jgi:SAM-dependent methyltransferase
VACGPGLAAQLAAERGAEVAGIDAAEASIAIARERTPRGDFQVGDMEALPWPDATFDAVTSFNGFQFAADLTHALREARRVTRPGGRVAVVVWGRDEDCDIPQVIGTLRELLPPAPMAAQTSTPLSAPGRLDDLLREAGMTPLAGGEVDVPAEFPDLDTAQRALLSSGAAVGIIQRVGAEPVERTLADALARFRTDRGWYVLRNRFRYVVAGIPSPPGSIHATPPL